MYTFASLENYLETILVREKVPGLDLRVFDDAITFKIALMVVKYMKYMENVEY